MAIERVRFLLKQDLMIKASQRASEAAELFRAGQGPEASDKLMEADSEFSKTKVVDTAFDALFKQLQEGKIDDLPIEELQKLLGQIEEKEVVVVEPQLEEVQVPVESQPVAEPAPVQQLRPEAPPRLGRQSTLNAKAFIIEQLKQASKENPVTVLDIAQPIWSNEHDPKKLKTRLFNYWGAARGALAEEGWEIINLTGIKQKLQGQEARYYLVKKTEVDPIATQPKPEVVEKPTRRDLEVVKVDYKLAPEETYLLAYVISQEENLKNLGISLHKSDQEEVSRIVDRIETPTIKFDKFRRDEQLSRMRAMLVAFAENQSRVVEANQGQDAEYLFSLLSDIKSEQQVVELLAGL